MKKTTTSNRLKEILEQRQLKQTDVLRLCEPFCKKHNIKMGRNDLSQYVSGKVVPKQDKLSILGLALNVDEVWLMGYDVPMARSSIKTKATEKNNYGVLTDRLQSRFGNIKLTENEIEDILSYVDFVLSKRRWLMNEKK